VLTVYVPYTKLERATRKALSIPGFTAVDTSAEGAYIAFMAERWREGIGFINVEHDAVPWPGAIRKLWECKAHWCAYGHTEDVDFSPGTGYETSLHCCKFSTEVIARTPSLSDSFDGVTWMSLATHITEYMHKRGIFVHQHYPPIPNLGRAE